MIEDKDLTFEYELVDVGTHKFVKPVQIGPTERSRKTQAEIMEQVIAVCDACERHKSHLTIFQLKGRMLADERYGSLRVFCTSLLVQRRLAQAVTVASEQVYDTT